MNKDNIKNNIIGVRNALFLGAVLLPSLYVVLDDNMPSNHINKIDVNQENFTSAKPASGFVANEIDCLARNIYFEARGESNQEQVSVGFVTLNRLASIHYPNTVCEVVYQPSQFSWTLENDSYKTIRDSKAWIKAKKVASYVYQSPPSQDTTNGSTHYYAHGLINAPFWVDSGYDVVKMASHTYMKLQGGV